MSRRPLSARRFTALFRKELHSLFAQPIFYVVAAFFLLLSGYYFYTDLVFFVTFGFGENIFVNFFQLLFVDLRLVLLLTVPLLTMRAFAEEKRLGTIELLFTYPLSDLEIYLAKLAACGCAATVLLAGTSGTLFYLYALQPFPWGAILVGYAGLLLLALSFTAYGLLLSSVTESQVVAAMSSVGTLLLLWVLSWNEPSPGTGPASWIARLSIFDHFEGFSRGVIESKDLVYFACLIVFAATATLLVLGTRTWGRAWMAPTVVGFAGLLVALGGAIALSEQHGIRFDLTPQKTYTLTPHARRIVERLSRDVELVAFVRSGDPRNADIVDLIERIAAVSPLVQPRVVDLNRNPAMTRRYGVDSFGAVVVESGGRRHVFRTAREDLIVGAMLELSRSSPRVVAFAKGHGAPEPETARRDRRRELNQLAGVLADDGNTVRTIDLGAGVPADTTLLVVAGGGEPWLPSEISALDAWMKRGGRLLALLDPLAAPPLSGWLASVGIAPRADVVLDPENRMYGGEGVSIEASPAGARAGSPASAEDIRMIATTLDHGVLLSSARSLDVEKDAVPLLDSSAGSWATTKLDEAERGFATFDGSRDVRGPLVVAAAREWKPAGAATTARVVVVGDVDFATNAFLDFVSNSGFLQNAINWLAGDEDLIALHGRTKEIGVQQFFLSAAQARFALVLGVGILPGIAALIAAGIALRKRFAR